MRGQLARYRGAEVDTAGDGFFATFDGPARAVRCAISIVDAVARLGIEVRAGVHTGEVQTIDGKVGGMAVVIGARVGASAGPSEVAGSKEIQSSSWGSRVSAAGPERMRSRSRRIASASCLTTVCIHLISSRGSSVGALRRRISSPRCSASSASSAQSE